MIVDHRGGMLDGGLPKTSSDAPVEEAQAEFLRNLSAAEERAWTAEWHPGDEPECWESDLKQAD